MHYMMSDADMTIGELCNNFDISDADTKTLLTELGKIAGTAYTGEVVLTLVKK